MKDDDIDVDACVLRTASAQKRHKNPLQKRGGIFQISLVLFSTRFLNPDPISDQYMKFSNTRFQTSPLKSIPTFRPGVRFSKLPITFPPKTPFNVSHLSNKAVFLTRP